MNIQEVIDILNGLIECEALIDSSDNEALECAVEILEEILEITMRGKNDLSTM